MTRKFGKALKIIILLDVIAIITVALIYWIKQGEPPPEQGKTVAQNVSKALARKALDGGFREDSSQRPLATVRDTVTAQPDVGESEENLFGPELTSDEVRSRRDNGMNPSNDPAWPYGVDLPDEEYGGRRCDNTLETRYDAELDRATSVDAVLDIVRNSVWSRNCDTPIVLEHALYWLAVHPGDLDRYGIASEPWFDVTCILGTDQSSLEKRSQEQWRSLYCEVVPKMTDIVVEGCSGSDGPQQRYIRGIYDVGEYFIRINRSHKRVRKICKDKRRPQR